MFEEDENYTFAFLRKKKKVLFIVYTHVNEYDSCCAENALIGQRPGHISWFRGKHVHFFFLVMKKQITVIIIKIKNIIKNIYKGIRKKNIYINKCFISF